MWYIGAGLAIIGSVCSNLGVNTQKYAFIKNAKLGKNAKTSYLKQPLWCLGLFLVIGGSLGDFAALAFAAQSIVAPIGSVTLVANLFFAHFWLHEHLSRRDLFGTVLIIGGSTMAVAFGDHSSKNYTINELQKLYGGTLFLIYGAVIVVCCIIFYVVAKKLEPTKKALVTAITRYDEAFQKGDEAEIIAQDSIIADLEAAYQPYEKVHPFSYCALSGMLGANSILFGKMVAEAIASTFAGSNQMVNPFTYLFLLCMFATIFSQLHFLALALQHFDALYVVPIFQCFFITISTIGGACFFLEFSDFQTIQIIMFPIGIFVTLTGVYLLSARKMDNSIKRMNQEETRTHCEQKLAEQQQLEKQHPCIDTRRHDGDHDHERSDSMDSSDGSTHSIGGLTPCTTAIKRQVSGGMADEIPPLQITVDVAHRHNSMVDIAKVQRESNDSQGNPIEMNPLQRPSKYQVPGIPIHNHINNNNNNKTIASAYHLSSSTTSPNNVHTRNVSQRLHGAMVPNAVGHGVLMVVGADHVDEVTPTVKDEISMNDGTVVVVTSRYARKSLNRAPDETPRETPRSSIIRTKQSPLGSPVISRHASPVNSPPTSPKSRARSILNAYQTAIIGSTPLHHTDHSLPPPLSQAYLVSHGLHVANPHNTTISHGRSTTQMIAPHIAAALHNQTSPSHTINIASTTSSTRTTPRTSMIHVANIAPTITSRPSVISNKPRFSLTKATSVLPNGTKDQNSSNNIYTSVPDDSPRINTHLTVDIMPTMVETSEIKSPKRTHTITNSDDSSNSDGSKNNNTYIHLAGTSPPTSTCPSPSAMAENSLTTPNFSKAFSLSMTPSSTQPLMMRTSSVEESDLFHTQASINEYQTQPSMSPQLSLSGPDPPSQIGSTNGISSILLKDERSSSDADTCLSASSSTSNLLATTSTITSSPKTRSLAQHHTRSRTSLLPTAPIDPDDETHIDMDIETSHSRRISLAEDEKMALTRAAMTQVNTTLNAKGGRIRPTSMAHMTNTVIAATNSSSTSPPTSTTIPSRITSASVTNKRVIPQLSPLAPSRVRLNLHGTHAELVPAPTTTTTLAVAIASATANTTTATSTTNITSPTSVANAITSPSRRRSMYAQQKEAASLITVPQSLIVHGRRASMDRGTVVPVTSSSSSIPTHTQQRRISPRMEQLQAPFVVSPTNLGSSSNITPTHATRTSPSTRLPVDVNMLITDAPTPALSPSGVSINMAMMENRSTTSSRETTPRNHHIGVTTQKTKAPPKSMNAW